METAHGDGLTPYVSTLRHAVEAALSRVLRLPEGHTLEEGATGRGRGSDGGLCLRVTADSGEGVVIDLRPTTDEAPCWVRGEVLSLSYRQLEDGTDPTADPRWSPVLQSLADQVRALTDTDLGEVRETMARERAFQGVEDWMFRVGPRPRDPQPHGTLRLGFRCNQDCGLCWQSRSWPDPPDALYFVWLDELAAQGARYVRITGGEPTLHAALPDLVERAVQTHRMQVWLETNAIQLRRPALVERLKAAGLREIFVSLHSADPEVSDEMTRAPGTFKGTVAGIEASLAAGLSVSLNCVVERRNVARLAEHARHVVTRFVRPFPENPIAQVTYSHPCGYYDQALFEQTVVPLETVRPRLLEAIRILQADRVPIECVGTCHFPPCLFHEVPEVIRWIDVPALEAPSSARRIYGAACDGCAMRPHCLGFREEQVRVHGLPDVTPFATLPARPEAPGRPVAAPSATDLPG
jgi:uncharacterized Fe-S cluster-containing radical SAM superfamily protein